MSNKSEQLLKQIISTVLGIFHIKGNYPVEKMEMNGSTLVYAGDVGMLISILIELHEIFEFDFNLDLNKVEETFDTMEKTIGYFVDRFANEKFY